MEGQKSRADIIEVRSRRALAEVEFVSNGHSYNLTTSKAEEQNRQAPSIGPAQCGSMLLGQDQCRTMPSRDGQEMCAMPLRRINADQFHTPGGNNTDKCHPLWRTQNHQAKNKSEMEGKGKPKQLPKKRQWSTHALRVHGDMKDTMKLENIRPITSL